MQTIYRYTANVKMKNTELNKLLRLMGNDELDEHVIEVLNLLRTNTPISEQRIARVIFTSHLLEKDEKDITALILSTFYNYAKRWNAKKVMDKINEVRIKMNR